MCRPQAKVEESSLQMSGKVIMYVLYTNVTAHDILMCIAPCYSALTGLLCLNVEKGDIYD